MAFPERTTINQKVQVGVENTSTPGTPVTSGMKLLLCFDWAFQIDGDVVFYTATGHKYPAVQEENTEWIGGTFNGKPDYNGLIYPLASIMGSVSPVAHGASATAKDWVFTPPTIGSIAPQTFTLQQGDANRAHQTAYSIFTELGYKGTRKDFSCSGKFLGYPISDGITLGSSPTSVVIAPAVSKHFNVYFDTTQAGLGTTLLTRVLSIDYLFTNVYGALFVLNRANVGWTVHVDLMPKATMKLKLEADSNGMALLPLLQSGATMYLRVNAQGAIIDNLQTVTIGGGATGGTFTLGYKGQTTANITYSATLAASVVNTAFQGLSTVGSNCTVTGAAGGPYIFTFSGALASDMSPVIATNTGLSGGTPTIASVAQAYNVFQHDMAVKLNKPTGGFADDQGVFALEWELTVVEDPVWGKAQTMTLTNLLTAL